MENFRSMSCREGRMQMENYNNNNNNNNNNNGGGKSSGPPTSMQDLRSYSTSYASNYMQVHPQPSNKDSKGNHNHNYNHNINHTNDQKKNKGFGSTSYSNSSTKGWSLTDPELQRMKRVASYKVYAVEGKMKGSFRKSFRWVKHTCSQVVYGWW